MLFGNNSQAAYSYADSRSERGSYRFDLFTLYLVRQLVKIKVGQDLNLKFDINSNYDLIQSLDQMRRFLNLNLVDVKNS